MQRDSFYCTLTNWEQKSSNLDHRFQSNNMCYVDMNGGYFLFKQTEKIRICLPTGVSARHTSDLKRPCFMSTTTAEKGTSYSGLLWKWLVLMLSRHLTITMYKYDIQTVKENLIYLCFAQPVDHCYRRGTWPSRHNHSQPSVKNTRRILSLVSSSFRLKTFLIEFRSDDVTKMILLKLWDFFNCLEQPIWKKFTHKKIAL